MSMHKYTA